MNKTEIERNLDGLAQAHANETAVNFAKAYSEVLATPRGRELYASFKRATIADAPAMRFEKDAGIVNKNQNSLDAMAKSYAQSNGISFAHAYAAILNSDKGRELYRAVAHGQRGF